jgi:hypothetical protein
MTGTNLNKYAQGKSKNMTKAMYAPRQGETLTVDKITEKTFVGKDGKDEVKLQLSWVEDRPPLMLNKTNLKFLIAEFGPEEADYAGRKVEVWHDPTVELSGQMVGGLKLRLPRGSVR